MSTQQGIDTLAKEQLDLKTELTQLKNSLQKEDSPSEEIKEDLHTVQEFLDHFHSCDKEDCEITELKEKESKDWFLKGIDKGIKVGKLLKK